MRLNEFLIKIKDSDLIGQSKIKQIPIRCKYGQSIKIAYAKDFNYDNEQRKFFLCSPQYLTVDTKQFNAHEQFVQLLEDTLKGNYWYIDFRFTYSEKDGSMFLFYSWLDEQEIRFNTIDLQANDEVLVGTNVLLANTFSDSMQQYLVKDATLVVEELINDRVRIFDNDIQIFKKQKEVVQEPVKEEIVVQQPTKQKKQQYNKRREDIFEEEPTIAKDVIVESGSEEDQQNL